MQLRAADSTPWLCPRKQLIISSTGGIIISVCCHYCVVCITIQTAGVAFGGTGLCSYRVGGVDGSCAKPLTVESNTVIYAANSHTYYY